MSTPATACTARGSRGKVLYLLLLGGDKSSQKRDIQRAIDMAHEVGNE